jgi:hypothetical protein
MQINTINIAMFFIRRDVSSFALLVKKSFIALSISARKSPIKSNMLIFLFCDENLQRLK